MPPENGHRSVPSDSDGPPAPDPEATGPGRRGPSAIAASILAVLLAGGYVMASPDVDRLLPPAFLVNAVVLILAFWFPAVRLHAPDAIRTHWRSLVLWLLAWTLVWDLASAAAVMERTFLDEWYLVYPAGVGFLLLLLLFHTWLVSRVNAAPSG